MVADLQGAFPSAPLAAVLFAVKTYPEDVGRAASLLGDHQEDGFLSLMNKGDPAAEVVPCGPGLQRETSQIVAQSEMWRAQETALAKHNFLVRVVHFIEDKVRTVNHRCLLCDDPLHLIGLKPACCPKPLCVMGYEEYGLGQNLASELVRAGSVIDLLISFLWSAVFGGRISLMYPGTVSKEQPDGTIRSFLRAKGDSFPIMKKSRTERSKVDKNPQDLSSSSSSSGGGGRAAEETMLFCIGDQIQIKKDNAWHKVYS